MREKKKNLLIRVEPKHLDWLRKKALIDSEGNYPLVTANNLVSGMIEQAYNADLNKSSV